MATLLNQPIGAILDNIADVIEGGTTWRGSGTSYYGVPGRRSNDPEIMDGTDTPLTANSDSGNTTTVVLASTKSWDSSRWVKDETPGFWLLCTSATDSNNVDKARKITGWNNTTKTFTVSNGFYSAPKKDDVFAVLQGFKRMPNGVDIEDAHAGTPHGFDRFFHLLATAGEQIEWYGSGVATFKATLELRLRLLTYDRAHDAQASAFENMALIRSAITRGANPDHRDGTYTRALLPQGGTSEITSRDAKKIIIIDKYILLYRVSNDFK